jgi:hypothetical protein
MIFASQLFLACVEDGVTDRAVVDTDDTAADTEVDTGAGENLLPGGTWVSEGDNISALLAYFDFVRVEADFTASSYEVRATDADGLETTFTGSYTVDLSTVPHGITLAQASPSAATSSGIWQVEGSTLTYEVVQTSPSSGCTPPTPDAGFGTTACGQPIPAGSNVQTFVR